MVKTVQINSGDLMGRRFNGFDLKPHLEAHGVSAKQLVYWNKQSDADFVERVFDYPGSRLLTRGLNIAERRASLHARLHPHSWTLPMNPSVREADLMHLHIIHDGYFSVSALPFVTRRKPTVWTWHDPWVMTGHCIHPLDCPRWQTGCGNCPDLARPFPMRRDRTAEQFAWKDRIYRNTQAEIVVASDWMRDLARRSPLAAHFNINVIPFGIDLDLYRPGDQAAARERLGIRPGLPVVFLRSMAGPYKGLPEFVAALDRLDPELRLCILTMQEIGHFDRFIGRHQIIEHGWSDDQSLLLDAFAACDFFAMPSRGEAFGLMAIEAMACGRPVLSLQGTALAGITFAPDAGLSVPKDDIDTLARAISHLATEAEDRERRGTLSRKLAERHYDIREQARRTAELYYRVLGRERAAEPRRSAAAK